MFNGNLNRLLMEIFTILKDASRMHTETSLINDLRHTIGTSTVSGMLG